MPHAHIANVRAHRVIMMRPYLRMVSWNSTVAAKRAEACARSHLAISASSGSIVALLLRRRDGHWERLHDHGGGRLREHERFRGCAWGRGQALDAGARGRVLPQDGLRD